MSNESEQHSEALPQGEQSEPAVEFPGKRLQEVREAAHLSREEVGRNLNLDARLIAALEENDQDKLPPPAYVCGYLRSYARLLKLPEEEIVESFNQGRELETMLVPENMEMHAHSGGGAAFGKIALGLGVILVVIAVVLWHDKLPFLGPQTPAEQPLLEGTDAPPPMDSLEPTPLPQSPLEQQAPALELPAAVEPAPLEDTVDEPPIGQSDGTAPAQAPAIPAPPTEPAPPDEVQESSEPAPQADGADAQSETPVAPAEAPPGQDSLRLEYSQDSWTEVRDGEDRVLVYRLVKAGESLELRGAAPFTVLLGYAPGVDVFYAGEPFDLSSYMRDDIAYFVVGQQAGEEQ